MLPSQAPRGELHSSAHSGFNARPDRMFSFFKKKPPQPEVAPAQPAAPEPVEAPAAPPEAEKRSWFDRLRGVPAQPEADAGPDTPPLPEYAPVVESTAVPTVEFLAPVIAVEPQPEPESARRSWMDKLRGGLRKTGSSIAQVFTGTQIDDALYEELESALLMADAGVKATEYLLADLKWRVNEERAADPQAVKALLANAITDLLRPLERGLRVGEHVPTVIMVVGVNGAGKTTSIGKLTRHLADANQKVLLAAADTFRAAAREQLAVWAGRNRVEIIGQEGGDPAAVTFDAVVAGKARGCDVVIADTAGRLTTQTHLMEELKKIRRVIGKAQEGAPHEVVLVVDGNTGQNALTQVQAFDAALQLTGLVISKLDGTAKGGVLAAIALWSRERTRTGGGSLPVYFIGVGEKLEDLQTFNAREFAQALLS
jgi:fused signal recognition particle receptor